MGILVATDFSLCSQAAVRLAAAIARRRSVPLLLVHAVEQPIIDVAALPSGLVGWERDLLAAAESMIANDARRLRDQGIAVETRVVLGGAVEAIREAVVTVRPELVVVGTHGRRGAARVFLGSVAEGVVRKATCPVLVTGEGEPDLARWSGQAPLRLAIATDGSSAGHAALAWMRGFEASRPCELSIVHVYWPVETALRYGLDDPWGGRPRGPELVRLIERDLRREAESALGHVPALRLRVTSGDAAEALTEEATLLGADAVVIGIPRRRSARWTAVAPGAVLRAAPLPILCIPESMAPVPRELPTVSAILLPTDFSEASREAILPAYSLLRAGGGHIELCTVHVLAPHGPGWLGWATARRCGACGYGIPFEEPHSCRGGGSGDHDARVRDRRALRGGGHPRGRRTAGRRSRGHWLPRAFWVQACRDRLGSRGGHPAFSPSSLRCGSSRRSGVSDERSDRDTFLRRDAVNGCRGTLRRHLVGLVPDARLVATTGMARSTVVMNAVTA